MGLEIYLVAFGLGLVDLHGRRPRGDRADAGVPALHEANAAQPPQLPAAAKFGNPVVARRELSFPITQGELHDQQAPHRNGNRRGGGVDGNARRRAERTRRVGGLRGARGMDAHLPTQLNTWSVATRQGVPRGRAEHGLQGPLPKHAGPVREQRDGALQALRPRSPPRGSGSGHSAPGPRPPAPGQPGRAAPARPPPATTTSTRRSPPATASSRTRRASPASTTPARAEWESTTSTARPRRRPAVNAATRRRSSTSRAERPAAPGRSGVRRLPGRLGRRHTLPPSLFGQEFELVATPNRYGLPPFYELHAWLWKHNPSGMFNDWNPRVSCDFA